MTDAPIEPEPMPIGPRPTLEEILRDANVKPVENIHDLAVEGVFESDEELEEFLFFYREQRQRDLG
jgi:hypothetical protein